MDNQFSDVQKVKQLEGTVLQDKYMIDRKLGNGSFGTVHKIKSVKANDKYPLVVKSSSDAVMLYNEITSLDCIQSYLELNEDKIPLRVAYSFPINCGRGMLYLKKS